MTEFEKVRRDLSAEFADAGRALMDYMTRPGMGPDTVLAAIPDTELYVIAGTLGGIARMLQKVGGAAPTVAGLEGLTRWQPEYGGDDQEPAIMETQDGEYVLFADVERWAASHAGASAVPAERDLGLPELADEFFAFGNLGGRFTLSWRECLRLYEAMTTSQAATPSTAAVRAAALEEAAKLCEQIESERFDAYKGRGQHEPNNPWRADPYVNGESDGAGQCANKIRALINTPAADGGNRGEDA